MVRKTLWKALLLGAVAGVAAVFLSALGLSLALGLGYFAACPAALPEMVGGEMNAVLLETVIGMLLGAGGGAIGHFLRRAELPLDKKRLYATLSLVAALVLSAVLFLIMSIQ